jgi:uncharacterized protein
MQSSKPLIAQGWLRVIIFCIFFLGLMILLSFGGKFSISDTSWKDASGISKEIWLSILTNLLASVISVWLFRRFIDRQSMGSLGFKWDGFSKHAYTGFFAAIAMIGIATLLLIALNYLQFTQWNVQPMVIMSSVFLMLLVAFSEELVFRGYLLNNLMHSTNKWVALLISSALFAAMHISNPGAGVLPIIEVFVGGIMLGINYIYTRNLWFGIFLHFAWNFFQGPVFGYKVSGVDISPIMLQELTGPTWLNGGAFGLEGSILAIILNLLLIGILVTVYNRSDTFITNKLTIN